jgi:branched-chain amino acid transport system substrate-binding protein
MGRNIRMGSLLRNTLLVLVGISVGASAYGKAAKTPYKIGAVFSVTGPASPLGTPEKDTALLIEEQINKAGGINGHPLKIIVLDTKSKETDCVLAVKNLLDQNVIAIVGPSQTGESLALLDTASRAGIPVVSCAAGVGIVQPVKKWVFKTAQSDVHAVSRLIDYMKKKGIEKIAVISVSNAFGESGKQQLREQTRKARIKIVAEETFGDNDRDMTSQLTRIRAKKPQAVVCWGTNPGPAVVAKNMRQLGMKQRLLMSHGIANKKFIELAGDAANGVVFPAGRLIVVNDISASDPQRKVLLQYAAAFKSKFKKEPDTFGGHAADAIQLVAQALRKVGPDKAKIRNTIEGTKGFVGIGGVFNFTPEDHNGLSKSAFALVTIKNGKWCLAK